MILGELQPPAPPGSYATVMIVFKKIADQKKQARANIGWKEDTLFITLMYYTKTLRSL